MDKTRYEKEAYERTSLLVTEFEQEDVILTSLFDDQSEIIPKR